MASQHDGLAPAPLQNQLAQHTIILRSMYKHEQTRSSTTATLLEKLFTTEKILTKYYLPYHSSMKQFIDSRSPAKASNSLRKILLI